MFLKLFIDLVDYGYNHDNYKVSISVHAYYQTTKIDLEDHASKCNI